MGAARPRILTPRLVAVALAAGVLLAALSVPAGAIAMQRRASAMPTAVAGPPVFALAEYSKRDGHIVLVTRRDFPTGTIHRAMSAPDGASWVLAMAAGIPNAGLVERDARPGPLREPLDGRDRWSEMRSAGWPFAAAFGVERSTTGGMTRKAGLWEVAALGRTWVVPYAPRWPGLLANTLFYAGLVLAILAWLRARTMRRRRAAGRCLACGYELGAGVERCPECGLAQEAGHGR
ncbi:MAG: hypothetical protein RIE32_11225 [Phycisphaerales bacterium]